MSVPSVDPPVPAPAIDAGPGLEPDVPLPEPDGNGAGPRLDLVRDQGESASPSTDHTRFRLRTIADLRQLPPLEWLIERHIPENALAVLYGPPGGGKSFLAMSWSLAIARGASWIDRPTKRGPVIYVTGAGEGERGLSARIDAYCDAHELSGALDAFFVTEPVNLLDLRDVDDLLRMADVQLAAAMLEDPATTRVNPSLVVFDTMARVMPGGDENSAKDVGLVIAAADRIRRAADTGVLLVHHTQKAGELERGSSALRGAADAMFALAPEDDRLVLTCTKQKDAPATTPRQLRLAPVGGSCVIEPVEGQPLEVGPTVRQLLRTIREVSIERETTASILIDSVRLSKASVYRSLRIALERGFVRKRGSKYSLSDSGEAECLTSLT